MKKVWPERQVKQGCQRLWRMDLPDSFTVNVVLGILNKQTQVGGALKVSPVSVRPKGLSCLQGWSKQRMQTDKQLGKGCTEAGRPRDGARDRRVRKLRKMWFGDLYFSQPACSICPSLQRARVTSSVGNGISRLNIPSSLPSPLLLMSPFCNLSTYQWQRNGGGDCRQWCSYQMHLRSLCHR